MADQTGGSQSSRKVQLVAELTNKVKELDAAFRGIETSSRGFAQNILKAVQAMAGGAGGSSGGMSSSFNFGSGTAGFTAGSNPYPSSIDNAGGSTANTVQTQGIAGPARMGFARPRAAQTTIPPANNGNTGAQNTPSARNYNRGIAENTLFAGSLLGPAVGFAAAFGTLGAPAINDALQLNLLANRQRFYGGAPNIEGGFALSKRLSMAGTPTSPLDAALAANEAVGYGMLPSNQSYGQTLNSAAMISNLAPGIGIQGGMSAMGALNAPGTVNRLRMFGINVRNPQGTGMNSFQSIIDRLWKILSASMGGSPSKDDIAVSAMPGNALDSILNQYFGGNENLKFAVLFALQQKAQGGALSKEGLQRTGALPEAISSVAGMNTTLLNAYQQASPFTLQGMMGANRLGTGIIDMISGKGAGEIFGKLIQLGSFIDAFAGLNQGAGGTLLTSGQSLLGGSMQKIFGRMAENKLTQIDPTTGRRAPDYAGAVSSQSWGSILSGLINGAAIVAAAAGSGALSEVDQGSDVVTPKGIARSGSSNGININVTMNGDYTTGSEAGVAIAQNVNKELARLAMART